MLTQNARREMDARPDDPRPYRIVVAAEMWRGSTPAACVRALRDLGHLVADVDTGKSVPAWSSLRLKAAGRLLLPALLREYNDRVLRACVSHQPDIFFTVKGIYLSPQTLRKIRGLGIATYNYYPDTSLYTHHPWLPETVPQFDCVFVTKRFQLHDAITKWGVRDCQYVPHGYDPGLHRPLPVTAHIRQTLGAAVCVTAVHTEYKEQLLADLIDRLPGLDLKIYGNGWGRCRTRRLRPHIVGSAVLGDVYAETLISSTINLGLLSGPIHGSSQGDETTTRTFEIPACGAFMLHLRTPELAEYFEDGREVATFESGAELAAQVKHFLANETSRQAIAAAGFRRCVPHYAIHARVEEMLAYHRRHTSAS